MTMDMAYRFSNSATRRMHNDLRITLVAVVNVVASLAESAVLHQALTRLGVAIDSDNIISSSEFSDVAARIKKLSAPMGGGCNYARQVHDLMDLIGDWATILENSYGIGDGEFTVAGCIAFTRRLEKISQRLTSIAGIYGDWIQKGGAAGAAQRIDRNTAMLNSMSLHESETS